MTGGEQRETPIENPDHLGGRLPLRYPHQLGTDQRAVHEALSNLVVPEGHHSGFTTRLADGRFIGPFNAMLRNPRITAGFGEWVRAIVETGLPEEVRQAVILTVAAHWRAPYEIYAHTAAARTAGISDAAIDAILGGTPPTDLTPAAASAQRLATSLLRHHDVPDELYGELHGLFGEPGMIALLALLGQYQTVSSLLITFRVPAPTGSTGDH
ncbi:carboxymuconolactone decarboxylase family protein [Nocardia sp. NPDC005998]|uniref:carboxymuconolactone decarboxylase family protein n=1 Tax=Nocardia sp. NPDC005998 TaxID=3156894 RepID=UPI0033BC331A